MTRAIAAYWNEHIHDLEIARHPVGSRPFFDELAAYRYEKLHYLPDLVDFAGYRNRRVLEIGCGVGLDLARFAAGGAAVTGIDLAPVSIDLARANFAQQGLAAELAVMNGEAMTFEAGAFDVVYAHGVLQYTADPARMIAEIHRVLAPGGLAILMVYHRFSWLNGLSKVMRVELEHEDAPILRKYSIGQFRRLLQPFARVRIIPERFPVRSRLHNGLKARLYNDLFVGTFNRLPRRLTRSLGWHLMAFAERA